LHVAALPDGAPWIEFFRTEEAAYLLRFPALADFIVSADGRNAVCYPLPGVTDGTPEHLFLNQVKPLMLSRRGELVFHASAIETDGAALAFLAEAGRGKSTLAATFAGNGFRFLTDDGLWLRPRDNQYDVTPSHPSIRLWQDSERNLIEPGTNTAPALHFTSKNRFFAGSALSYCDEPRPLRAAYLLGDGRSPAITFRRLEPLEAFKQWVNHSFLIDLEDRALLKDHFEGIATLTNAVPCFNLDYPRRYEDLGRVRDAICKHALEEGS
jgi:hypothetical protein